MCYWLKLEAIQILWLFLVLSVGASRFDLKRSTNSMIGAGIAMTKFYRHGGTVSATKRGITTVRSENGKGKGDRGQR
jgi:hypothetical protein